MIMPVYIKAISYYLPEKICSNEDLVREFPEWSVQKVASKVGIDQRHIAAENETAADMGFAAADKLIIEYGIDKSCIDFVLLCTQSPDYFLPTSACIIQNRLGLRTDIGALDFNQGCSGFIYGLTLARGLVVSGTAKNVLVLTSETYSKYINPRDKGNRTIFGDAAAATLVSDSGFAEILDFVMGTDGKGADNLIVKTGGHRYRKPINDTTIDRDGNLVSSDHLYMNGAEIVTFTLELVPPLVESILLKNKIKFNDIDLFVFHQANKYLLNFLRMELDIPEEKFYFFLEKVGNTVSSTIPIALKEAVKEGKISPGNKVLVAGFGVGYSWGATILQF